MAASPQLAIGTAQAGPSVIVPLASLTKIHTDQVNRFALALSSHVNKNLPTLPQQTHLDIGLELLRKLTGSASVDELYRMDLNTLLIKASRGMGKVLDRRLGRSSSRQTKHTKANKQRRSRPRSNSTTAKRIQLLHGLGIEHPQQIASRKNFR